MRYPLSEKLEIIRLVERSHLPAKRTLAQLGIPRTGTRRFLEELDARKRGANEVSKGPSEGYRLPRGYIDERSTIPRAMSQALPCIASDPVHTAHPGKV